MTTNELIARWRGWTRENGHWVDNDGVIGYPPFGFNWEFDTDDATWRGPGGLLAEIYRKGLECDLYHALRRLLDPTETTLSPMGQVLMFLRATPAQLAEALVAVIGEK